MVEQTPPMVFQVLSKPTIAILISRLGQNNQGPALLDLLALLAIKPASSSPNNVPHLPVLLPSIATLSWAYQFSSENISWVQRQWENKLAQLTMKRTELRRSSASQSYISTMHNKQTNQWSDAVLRTLTWWDVESMWVTSSLLIYLYLLLYSL